MRQTTRWTLAALVAAGTWGCSSSSPKDGPVKVNDLVSSVERVYVEAEVSKEKAQAALLKLQVLAAADFDDATEAFADYVAALEESEEQAERLQDAVEPMKKAAEPVFKRWTESLDQYTSMSLRHRSQTRLMETRRRYDAIVVAADPAQQSYSTVNKSLRDHALFLSTDLNPSALAAIQEDVRALADLTTQLDTGLDETMVAARAYVESSALAESAVSVAASAPEEK